MIKVQVNDVDYVGFTEVSVSDVVDNLCNQMHVTCASEDGGFRFPIKRGSVAAVYANDSKIFTGVFEKSRGKAGETSFDISTGARDKNSEIIKSSLQPDTNFKGPISLKKIIEKTLLSAGIDRTITDETGGIDDLTKKELANEDVGADMFDFWVTLAAKRNCIISKDRSCNIVIRRSGDRKYQKKLYRLINDIRGVNNIVNSEWEFDDTERCHDYYVHSQINRSVEIEDSPPPTDEIIDDPSPETIYSDPTQSKELQSEILALQIELSTLVPGSERHRVVGDRLLSLGSSDSAPTAKRSRFATMGHAVDNGVPHGTVNHIVAEDPSDDDECKRLATWECNKARVKSVSYSCFVPDIDADGEPWESGYLVDVTDEIADVDATMLIRSVKIMTSKNENGDVEDGAMIELTIPDAFSDTESPNNSLVHIERIGANWNEGDFR